MLVLALVYAWLLDHPAYYSVWVNSYSQMRWIKMPRRYPILTAKLVGGHWRRRADWGDVVLNLKLVCNFDRTLTLPRTLVPPMRSRRQRRQEDGTLIPRPYRATIFVD